MLNQLSQASGFLVIFVPPLLLVAGIGGDIPSLAFLVLFVVTPLLRVFFGDADETAPEWNETIATALEWLPRVFAVFFLFALAYALWLVHERPLGRNDWIGLGLSLFATSLFANAVAHQLFHQRSALSHVAGRILAGVVGYPFLEHEHHAHHSVGGDVANAEWPRVDENAWAFSLRRGKRVLHTSWEGNIAAAQQRGRRFAGGLLLAVASTLAMWLAFYVAAGTAGAACYALTAVGVFWAMQMLTYLQHWGLGTDSVPGAEQATLAWEDRCQLQVWLTLAISYHQGHHHHQCRAIARTHDQPS